jgi:putative transposase
MNFNLLSKPRKSIRLKGFNYESAGYYFVTFCTQGRLCLFGEIRGDRNILNEAGDRVYQEIDTIKNQYFGFDIDTFVVMPNHVHAIVVIEQGRTRRSAPTGMSLSDLVKNIKTYTTIAYMQGVYQKNWPSFHRRLWQRGYYDHIIRNDQSLNNIRQYIIDNPLKCSINKENLIFQCK